MLPPDIDDQELLYRGVIRKPNFWKSKENRPSSAAFKDSNGVSVDRDGSRESSEIILSFERRLCLRAVVTITAEKCREFQTHPVAVPQPENIYHAEIHDSPNCVQISKRKARHIAESVVIVHQYSY